MSRTVSAEEWDNLEWLHVYGQFTYHSEATIKGTRAGLISLRAAIDEALASGRGEARLIASDGEGYRAEIICVSTHAELGPPEYVLEESQRLLTQEAERAREYGLRDPFGQYMRIDDPRLTERLKAISGNEGA